MNEGEIRARRREIAQLQRDLQAEARELQAQLDVIWEARDAEARAEAAMQPDAIMAQIEGVAASAAAGEDGVSSR